MMYRRAAMENSLTLSLAAIELGLHLMNVAATISKAQTMMDAIARHIIGWEMAANGLPVLSNSKIE
jgi:hypothetical protein